MNMGSSSSLRSSEEKYKLELGKDAETSMALGTTAVAEPVVAEWQSTGVQNYIIYFKYVLCVYIESGDQSQTVGHRVWLGCLWESSSPGRALVTSIIHPSTGFYPFAFTFPAPSSFLPAKQMSHCPCSLAFSKAHSQPLCQLKHIQIHALAEKQTAVAWDRNTTCIGICAYLQSISHEWNCM